MKLSLFLIFFLYAMTSYSAAPTSCQDNYEVFDNTQVQTIGYESACYVSIHPRNSYVDLIYRDFLFDNYGFFVVFNSYGPGPESQTTAAREYSFFPRVKSTLEYNYDASTKTLNVIDASGKVFSFNTEKSVLIGISGTKVTQDYAVNPNNNGGIEVVNNDGLYLDGGFKVGSSPSQRPSNKATFKDAAGNQCALVNSDVYRYSPDGDPIFKFNDAQLRAFLKKRCQNIQF